MIVESVPTFTARSEPSRSGPPDLGSSRGGEDKFGRALTDVLTADRADRSKPTERARPERAEEESERPAGRRVNKPDPNEGDQRRDEDDDRGPSADRVTAERALGRDSQPETDEHPPTEVEGPVTTGVDRAIERITEHVATIGDGNVTGLTTALAQLTDETDSEAVTAPPVETDTDLTVDPTGAIEAEPVASQETPAGSPLEPVEGGLEASTIAEAAADNVGGMPEPVAVDQPFGGGRAVAAMAREHRGGGLPGIIAAVGESTEGGITTVAKASDNASPVAALATSRPVPVADPPPTDTDSGETGADAGSPGSSTVAPEGATVAGVDVDTGTETIHTAEAAETAETAETADTAETAGTPNVSSVDRPPSPSVVAGQPDRPSVTAPTQPAATAVETSGPPPDLVELHTAGLAERLRPAFAAVRRSLNGLDELRLRIQDDNAGPIKVDIAAVDNRIRVLLSAGNDDLMRQLGQERERLADELRRAGFDEAAIDITSDGDGQRRSGYDGAGAEPTRSRTGNSRASDIAGGEPTSRSSSRRGRRAAGLDLDL